MTAASAPGIERRTEPRRGVVTRVGLVLAATGIASAAVDRRSLAGVSADVLLAVGFGLFLAILLIATMQKPPPAATWIALGAVVLVYLLAAAELASSLLGMTAYVLLAFGATRATAPHLRPLMVGAFALWTPALWIFGPTEALSALPTELRVASVIALAFTVYAIVDPRRTHPSDRLRHIGYGILAIACVSASIGRSLVVSSSGFPLGQALAVIAAIALPALSYSRMRARAREALATGIALAAFAFAGLAYIVGTPYGADVVAATHRAAELLLAGQNPYAAFDLPEALARFRMDPQLATHLLDGSVIRTYGYPPMSFLHVAPFVALGVADIRWVYLVEAMLVAVVAARQLKPAWRAMALTTVIGNEIITRQWILAGVDPSWALYLVGAWALRHRRVWSSVLLGLAIADRQPAWFVAPFFLLAISQRFGTREALRATAIAAGVAAAITLPFVIGAPERAIAGMLGPIFAPLVSDGVGLMRYGATAFGPALPRAAYTALSLTALAGLLVILWKRPWRLAGAALVWPFLPLYLAWRSLQNYFAAAPVFALIADDELAEERPEAVSPLREPGAAQRTAPPRRS